jgi:hypothetical protein
MTFSTPSLRRPAALLCGVAAACALAACGGDDEQQTAQQRVCDARANIRGQIDTISELPRTSASLAKAQSAVSSIRSDLRQIRAAQPELAPERRQEVADAAKAFENELASVARTALTAGVTGNASQAVQIARDDLTASFRTALAPIDCT